MVRCLDVSTKLRSVLWRARVSWVCVEMFRTHHLIIDGLPNDPLERPQRYSRLLFGPAEICVIISTMLQLNSQKERCQKERCQKERRQKEYLQKEAPRGDTSPRAHTSKSTCGRRDHTCVQKYLCAGATSRVSKSRFGVPPQRQGIGPSPDASTRC